jgi:putative effector of murein hydrolase
MAGTELYATLFCIALTIGAYALSRFVGRRFPSPFTTPVFLSTALIVALLLSAGVDFAQYQPAKEVLVFLLAPATVALAVPVYRNRRVLLSYLVPAGAGIVVGSFCTVALAAGLGLAFGLERTLLASLTVKSVTAPIAIELADLVQGNATLAAVFVIVTGMLGAMFGPWLMTRARIVDPLARGVALGTISHGQGTAQAVLEGELQGAVAGIAMGVAAVLTSVALPLLLVR